MTVLVVGMLHQSILRAAQANFVATVVQAILQFKQSFVANAEAEGPSK